VLQGVWFSEAKNIREIRPGSTLTGGANAGGVVEIGDFPQIAGYISKTVHSLY